MAPRAPRFGTRVDRGHVENAPGSFTKAGLLAQRLSRRRARLRPTSPPGREPLAVKSHEVVGRGVVHPGTLIEAGRRQPSQIDEEDPRLKIQKNARLTPHGRPKVIRQVPFGHRARGAERDPDVPGKTVHKWVRRAMAGEPF